MSWRTSRTTRRPRSSCWSTTGRCRCGTRSPAPGGFRISDGFISPLDLVEIGLMSAEEAKDLHDMETAGRGQVVTGSPVSTDQEA